MLNHISASIHLYTSPYFFIKLYNVILNYQNDATKKIAITSLTTCLCFINLLLLMRTTENAMSMARNFEGYKLLFLYTR